MTILVTGSPGKVGSTLIKLLHDKGVDVRAASSNPEKAVVESVKLALNDPADFPAVLAGVTSIFLYAEPSQIGAFIEQAEAVGVEHIVVMSSDSVLRPDAADTGHRGGRARGPHRAPAARQGVPPHGARVPHLR